MFSTRKFTGIAYFYSALLPNYNKKKSSRISLKNYLKTEKLIPTILNIDSYSIVNKIAEELDILIKNRTKRDC